MNAKNVNKSGQGMAEYIIIVILVAVICVFAVNKFGDQVKGRFDTSKQAVETMESYEHSKAGGKTRPGR